jgi:hypothetical protein
MWIEKAHVFYIEDNKKLKLTHFVLMDVWKIVRNEEKWITYNIGLKQARKRKNSDKENEERTWTAMQTWRMWKKFQGQ